MASITSCPRELIADISEFLPPIDRQALRYSGGAMFAAIGHVDLPDNLSQVVYMSRHESSKAITCARYSAALDELEHGIELEVNAGLGSPYARVFSTNDPFTIGSGMDKIHLRFLLTPYRFETTGNMIGRNRGMDLAQYYIVKLSKYAKERYAPKNSGFPKPRGNREYDTWKALHQRANRLLLWYFRFVMAWSAAIGRKGVDFDDDLEKTSPFEGNIAGYETRAVQKLKGETIQWTYG